MKDAQGNNLPQSYIDALFNDALLNRCVECGMSYPQIIAKLCERHGEMLAMLSESQRRRPMHITIPKGSYITFPNGMKVMCDDQEACDSRPANGPSAKPDESKEAR